MKLFFVSLGCDKNLVDSEKMLALLAEQNIEITEEPKEAEIIIVNTCGFIHDAKEESIETILEMAEYKKNRKVYITDRDRMSGAEIRRRNAERN